jgi:hypothetical protein
VSAIPTGQIVWIVNNLHVGTRDADVIRELYRRMRNNSVWTKPLRRIAYRYALEQHHANQRYYAAIARAAL